MHRYAVSFEIFNSSMFSIMLYHLRCNKCKFYVLAINSRGLLRDLELVGFIEENLPFLMFLNK